MARAAWRSLTLSHSGFVANLTHRRCAVADGTISIRNPDTGRLDEVRAYRLHAVTVSQFAPHHTGGNHMADTPKADFSDVEGGSSSTAPSSDQPRTITVQPGDSLSKIAKRELGDANKWHAIYEANRDKIKNPDLIYPGEILTLPPNS
jgi:nucleoid-associated protein YgaU